MDQVTSLKLQVMAIPCQTHPADPDGEPALSLAGCALGICPAWRAAASPSCSCGLGDPLSELLTQMPQLNALRLDGTPRRCPAMSLWPGPPSNIWIWGGCCRAGQYTELDYTLSPQMPELLFLT